MADKKPDTARAAWALLDELVLRSVGEDMSPWSLTDKGTVFTPNFALLSQLLGVPRLVENVSQSGLLAIAVDVWVANELRRAGFDADAVWPRANPPRVLPRALGDFVSGLPKTMQPSVRARFDHSTGTDTSRSPAAAPSVANILGKNYVKQVDVVISDWSTGPELLVSTKRMDGSYSSNALNRVEESYGDAKNLRLRHPLAAIGFVFVLSSGIKVETPATLPRIKDLLAKLGREDDAYHAVMLIMPDYDSTPSFASLDPVELVKAVESDIGSVIDLIPTVPLLLDESPSEIAPGPFFEKMIWRVLDATPVDFHVVARARRDAAVP